MPDKKLTADEVFDIADEMLAAAAAAQDKRRKSTNLSDAEFDAFVDKETALRYDADRYRAVGITLLAGEGAVNAQQLVGAIRAGQEALKTIAKVKKALTVLTSLVELGTAIASGDVQMILAKIAGLQAATASG